MAPLRCPGMQASAPLDGILVADFTRVLAGPLATMTLGDLGADVIKIESPAGDETRSWIPPETADGESTYYLAVNRNKRSLVCDLASPADVELARELAMRADVLVENFKPGTLERFGLGSDSLLAANPGLIHCSITAFGDGDGALLPGYDPLLQALSGLMSITGPPDREPSKVGVALIDVVAGQSAAIAILAALTARARNGEGQRIEIDLLSSALAALANQASGYLNAGVAGQRMGNVHPSIEPFATYATRDEPLMICAGNDRQFATLCEGVGAGELATDARFATNRDRVANRDELRELLESKLATLSAAQWTQRLRAAGVAVGPVNDIPTAFELARSLGLDPIDELDGVRTVTSPLGLRSTPATTRRRPPHLGEHSDEIRAWLQASGGQR